MSGDDGDDAYQKFQCPNNINLVYLDSGNFILGVARCLAFMMFIGFQAYNKVLLNRKQANNVNIIKGLILPSYLPFIYFYMLFSVATGLIDLINEAEFGSKRFDSWVYPVEIGITHWFSEGLAIFLMRYGAGIQAIRRSFRASLVWGLFTIVWFTMVFSAMNGRFNSQRKNKPLIFGLFVSYEIMVFLFYTAYAVIPAKYLYHRPALTFYARFNALSTGIVILFASLYYMEVYKIVCPGSIVAFIFAAFLQPLAIYKTLQIDSQYWQGLSPEPGNPLTEVWDHLGIETASSMAENLEQFGRINRKLPILHFGLMNFDTDLQYVAGGFSRVYFGSLRGRERVAFKILFAMELDPKDIEEFYREAAVLHTLKHPNVVQCLGVCVMPPALTIVLELCRYGSLFDFMYKPVAPLPRSDSSLAGLLRNSLIGTRNSLLGLPPGTDLDLHDSSLGGHYGGNNSAGGLELRAMGEMEPSFSNPTGKVTEEGWRTLSMSTTSSFCDNDVTNPMSGSSNSVSSNRPFSYPAGIGSLMRSSNANAAFNVARSPSVVAANAAETHNNAAKAPPGTTATASAAASGGSQDDEDDLPRDSNRPGQRAPADSSTTAVLNDSGGGGSGGSGGSGAAAAQKQRTARTLAAMMQAPFRANETLQRTFSRDGDQTPRQSTSSVRAPLGPSLSFHKRLVMMRDAIAGIAHLHAQGYMHCDIKSLNFLVAEDFVLKLADMGEARQLGSPPKRDIPPIPAMNWAPPEVLVAKARPEVYTLQSDVYGLCIVLAEIILAELPFGDKPNLLSQQRWLETLTVENLRPVLPEALPGPLRKIIQQGWSSEPSERPTAAAILEVIDEYVILNRPTAGSEDEV